MCIYTYMYETACINNTPQNKKPAAAEQRIYRHTTEPCGNAEVAKFYGSKLLILENTYINQEMMNSYVVTYHGAIHHYISW